MKKKISEILRKFLRGLGAEKQLWEFYRHSFQSEVMYKIKKPFLDEKISKEINGYSISFNPKNPGLEKDLFIHDLREAESTEIYTNFLDRGDQVLDIGANIGYYALLASEEVGGRGKVLAYEPVPSNVEKLRKNKRSNSAENIRVKDKAFSDKKEEKEIRIRNSPNLSKISKNGNHKVEAVSIDSIQYSELDALRMDIEGFECKVLEGGKNFLEKDSVKLFIEVHPKKMNRYEDSSYELFWDILEENKFEVKKIVRHPPYPLMRYFLIPTYPKRNVYEPNISVGELLRQNKLNPKNWENTFRLFLKK